MLYFASDASNAEDGLLVRAEVVDGDPYGVGFVEILKNDAIARGWHSDQTIGISDRRCRIWLPAVEESETSDVSDSQALNQSDDRIRVYFIYTGKSPASIEISFGNVRSVIATERTVGATHPSLLNSWWQTLCKQSHRGISETLAKPTDDFLQVLSSHLKLPMAGSMLERNAIPESKLEKQFERTLSMLLGFESVRLAMMIDESPKELSRSKATQPLPNELRFATIPVPSTAASRRQTIEAIATMIPNDCFYVRCRSIQNYHWMRQLLTNWGGSLDEIITSPSIESDIRQRLERQLGIDCLQCIAEGLDAHLNDIAILGSDMFFAEGAGIGVLLQIQPGHEQNVERIIETQRSTVGARWRAKRRTETVRNHAVSVIETEDHSVRSFCVRHGKFLLVTNSKALTDSFLGLEHTKKSLANLEEYVFANATSKESNDSDIKIYLSDPFFRRITSPACRVEWERRKASAMDSRRLEIAALIAKSLGYDADSVPSLIARGFLPADFGRLPDGSQTELRAGVAIDSVRGHVGTFVPVVDRLPVYVNTDESNAYARFATRYRREWLAMDPVLVNIRRSSLHEPLERVELDIHVSPYARQAYAFLTNYLASPTSTHIGLDKNSLIGISAHLKNGSKTFLAHVGLCDDAIPFSVQQGKLTMEGTRSDAFLVDRRSFAAVTPAGTGGLQILAGLVEVLQTREAGGLPTEMQSPAHQPSTRRRTTNWMNPFDVMFRFSEEVIFGFIELSKASSIYQDSMWSIYGANQETRNEARENLKKQEVRPTQIHLRAGGIVESQVAPYMHAYSYCNARQKSAANAAWLTRWTHGLRGAPDSFRLSIQQALNAEIVCPLGGKFTLQPTDGSASQWVSSAWIEPSLESENSVPVDYRFPFLQWLRSIELDFQLSPNSLSSRVVLEVAKDPLQPPPQKQPGEKSMVDANSRKIVHGKALGAPTWTVDSIATSDRPLTNVKYMYQGKYAVAVGFDRTASIFDFKSRVPLQVLRGHTNTIWTVDVSPDNSIVVTGSEDRTLRFWEVKTGIELGQIPANGIYSCVRFSADGRTVFATNWDGELRVIDPIARKLIRKFSYKTPILDVALFPEGGGLVLGTVSGSILHCDLQSGKVKRELKGHTATVHGVAFVDADRVLSASHDKTLRLWNLSTGLTDHTFSGHTAAVHEVRVMPTRDRFVSSSADGSVRVWDLNSDQSFSVNSLGLDVRGISVSPDDSSILAACSDGKLKRIQLTERR